MHARPQVKCFRFRTSFQFCLHCIYIWWITLNSCLIAFIRISCTRICISTRKSYFPRGNQIRSQLLHRLTAIRTSTRSLQLNETKLMLLFSNPVLIIGNEHLAWCFLRYSTQLGHVMWPTPGANYQRERARVSLREATVLVKCWPI